MGILNSKPKDKNKILSSTTIPILLSNYEKSNNKNYNKDNEKNDNTGNKKVIKSNYYVDCGFVDYVKNNPIEINNKNNIKNDNINYPEDDINFEYNWLLCNINDCFSLKAQEEGWKITEISDIKDVYYFKKQHEMCKNNKNLPKSIDDDINKEFGWHKACIDYSIYNSTIYDYYKDGWILCNKDYSNNKKNTYYIRKYFHN